MPSVQVTTAARVVRPAGLVGRVLENHHALGVMMVTPALLILAIFLAYPFGLGVWLSFTNATIGQAGRFVGLGNFRYLLGDSVFRVVVLNTTLYAAAAVVCKRVLGFLLALLDGAGPWQKFWFVTWPVLLPLTVVVTVFSTIMTVGDFQLIWIITHGGPANATHLFGTLAYQRAIQGGFIGEGAAISAFVLPVLVGAVMVS